MQSDPRAMSRTQNTHNMPKPTGLLEYRATYNCPQKQRRSRKKTKPNKIKLKSV